ncbi:nucleotidyl transferase AbiEii/AbiGii toxin family protein [Xanthobacteraceae bacterium Astr-EGSB]|uniref:nucleotidyl transferase AbiEii/AbiGii toxin family protein n=1 Tax=Astrobacterium formosum TaxID=3069710 RepID=UPI0027AFF457|nr:nucleotidyl transferase AbiEii/AbiGii toxin family protein [Xanthobacteraceae bacterium Astr-EGSB]
MNAAYQAIISSSDDDRRDLFVTAASRFGTTVQNIEKDFWVCWTLDVLFHRLQSGGPRLLFKGGTSLSKGYGLISRFSEDIDITVFRTDIGEGATFEQLEALSRRKKTEYLDGIKTACQAYIADKLRVELDALAKETMEAAGRDPRLLHVVLDDDDPDCQSILIHYPSAVEKSDYVPPRIKIEAGAKSAIDPNEERIIAPYLAPDLPQGDELAIKGVTTIQPARTFLDKVLILQGMTFYHTEKGVLRGNGRMSRHYYDVHRLMGASIGDEACKDDKLIEDCVRHARMFFHRGHTGLDQAKRGSFYLRPTPEMCGPLRKDYDAMTTMIFGSVPTFEAVLESVARAEEALNAV